MRIPSASAVGRYLVAFTFLAGSMFLMSTEKKPAFTIHDKAFFAPRAIVEYVNPGLVFTIVSAKVASDGTISVDYKISDPQGLPLDLLGIQTPGVISPRYAGGYIQKGQTQFSGYVVNTVAATNGNPSVTQANADTGGTTATVAVGEYIYTFKNKAPATFDPSVTNRIAVYGNRNLTEWGLGTDYASTTFDFVPNGSPVTFTRDIVKTPDCNACHDSFSHHGGMRRGVEICVICHQPQTSDPNTGNSLDFKVLMHSIHMGSSLPSVIAGKPYNVGTSDWSTVVFPADVRRCQVCHNPKNGAAQTNNWLTNPNRAACGACHNDVNFATGLNHVNLPQADDSLCAQCHFPQGELEFDASIKGAHTIPDQSVTIPGLNFTMVKVVNGGAGQKPTVTFTVRDNQGNGIPMSTFTSNSGVLSLTMAGPTSDYGYTSFGTDVTTPGYVTETATGSSCSADGTCQYTFTHAVPAKATGTYAIGIEGRLPATLLPGTTVQMSTVYGGINQVIYFSTDGTTVQPRRTVVALSNCNNCHAYLEVHGSLRNNVTYCVLCHNPSDTDFATRPTSVVASDRTLPNQAINFALMVHKIHTGVNLAPFNQTYIVVGFGGSHNDFSGVRYPPLTPNAVVNDTTNCSLCHTGGSEANFPVGKNAVTDPQGFLNPTPATASACMACHLNLSDMAHAQSNTDPKFGESCAVCHGTGAAYDVDQVHAGK